MEKIILDYSLRYSFLVAYLIMTLVPLPDAASTAYAQGRLVAIRYYHGEGGRSQIISVEKSGEPPYESTTDQLPLVLCEGDEVRIDIMNANPVFYSYGLDVEAKHVQKEDLDLPLLSLLSQIPDMTAAAPTNKNIVMANIGAIGKHASDRADKKIKFNQELNTFIKNLNTLKVSLIDAAKLVSASDIPEPLDLVSKGSPVNGFSYAKKELTSKPDEKFEFGSTTLADDLKNDYQRAVALATDENDALLVEALKGHGAALLSIRDEIKRQFINVDPVVRVSAKVPANGGIFTFKIGAKDKSGIRARSVGGVLKIDVRPCYSRPSLEVHPYTFVLYHPDIRRFYTREGQVTMDTVGDFRGGVGSMLRWNFAKWGGQSEWYVSAGLGVGAAVGSDDVLGSFTGVIMLSYKEFSLGFGAGGALLPIAVKAPAQIGETLPADAGPLEDLVQSKLRGAWYLVFSVPVLNLAVK